jgi:hypothetical protein
MLHKLKYIFSKDYREKYNIKLKLNKLITANESIKILKQKGDRYKCIKY